MVRLRMILFALFASTAFAAPDEDELGKKQGYPVCPRPQGSFAAPHCLVGVLSHYDQVFPARVVRRGVATRELRRAPEMPRISHSGSHERGIDAFLAANRNTGLLIMKGDTILAERYQYQRTPEHRFTSMSMAKTVVGMLVGVALHEKQIRSIDDRAEVYVPELRNHPYGETPIRHLLTMSSGVKFVENYSGFDDIQKLGRALLFQEGPGGPPAVLPYRDRLAAPGERFSYASAETYVLGLVLRGATGRNLAEYLSEKIWQPMGAEADASWNIDPAGYELGYCCLNATLRDWGRFALLLAEGGVRDGKQIVPTQWIREATRSQARTPGYGYQTWVSLNEDRFALRGLRGQGIDVHPASRVVVVHTAVYGVGSGRGDQYSFFEAVLAGLGEKP